MTTYKDTDLREALRRKYLNAPQPDADFTERMMRRISQQNAPHVQAEQTPLVLKFVRFVSTVAALLLIGLFLYEYNEERTSRNHTDEQPCIAALTGGNTLKSVYKSYRQTERKEAISYIQIKNLHHE